MSDTIQEDRIQKHGGEEVNQSTWYKVSSYGMKIEQIQVIAESKSSITEQWEGLDWDSREKKTFTRRHNKSSTTGFYFPTWKEAHDFMEERARKRLAAAHQNLDRARQELEDVMRMKPEVKP